MWFIVGAQGRPVITQGTLWLILISILTFYIAYLFVKASKVTADPLKPFAKILAISLGGTAFGAFMGALPIIKPWEHFTIDFSQGFWFRSDVLEAVWARFAGDIIAGFAIAVFLIAVLAAFAKARS